MQKNILKIVAAMLALSLVLVACSDKIEKKSDSAMTKAGLAELLSSEGIITLFAPTNDAFTKVPS